MFTVDLNDGQWLQYMCTQILNAFTINKVGMHADVVTHLLPNGNGLEVAVEYYICCHKYATCLSLTARNMNRDWEFY